jgi:MATE family multidrug resistance protein
VLQALQPTIGQLYGAGRVGEIGHEVKQGMWLAVLLHRRLADPDVLAALLAVAKASPELVEKATLYLRIEALALPATLFFRVYSSLNTALAKPKMVMALQLGGLLLKLPLNALLIFGGLGLPALAAPVAPSPPR